MTTSPEEMWVRPQTLPPVRAALLDNARARLDIHARNGLADAAVRAVTMATLFSR
jgi:hypothetical protein